MLRRYFEIDNMIDDAIMGPMPVQTRLQPSATVLHDAASVLSAAHKPTWFLLAAAAGAINAGALLVCERLVTHVTGTVTRIGVDVGVWTLMVDYVLVLVSFVAGAMTSVFILQARARNGDRVHHALPLWITAALVSLAAILGHLGWFGPVGGTPEQAADFALMCKLAFAMGLMNASVASSTALSVRTTHMTGPATDFGVHLALAWLALGEERQTLLRVAALRGGKVIAFILGAAAMVPLVRGAGYLAFAAPSVVIVIAALRSFVIESAHAHPNQMSAST